MHGKQVHAQHSRHVGNRLWEAWAWLDAHAFVARSVVQDTPDAQRVNEEPPRRELRGLVLAAAAVPFADLLRRLLDGRARDAVPLASPTSGIEATE